MQNKMHAGAIESTHRTTTKPLLLADRFQLLEPLPGMPEAKLYLASDQQSSSYVLCKLVRKGNPQAIPEEARLSQLLHDNHFAQHFSQIVGHYADESAHHILATLPEPERLALEDEYDVNNLLVTQWTSHWLHEKKPAITWHQLCGELHSKEASSPFLKTEQDIFLAQELARELLNLLEELAPANIVHNGLNANQIRCRLTVEELRCLDLLSLPSPTLIANDWSQASESGTPTQSARRDLCYLSPQRLKTVISSAQPSEPSDDIFAIGALLYQLLTGQPPFSPPNDLPRLQRIQWLQQQWIQHETPPLIEAPSISDDILHIIQRMCSRKPEDRPSAGKLHNTLTKPWSQRFVSFRELATNPFPEQVDMLILHVAQLADLAEKATSSPSLKMHQAMHFPKWCRELTERLQVCQQKVTQNQFKEQSERSALQKECEQLKINLQALQEDNQALTNDCNELRALNQQAKDSFEERLEEIKEQAFDEGFERGQQEPNTSTNALFKLGGPSHPMQTQNNLPMIDPSAQLINVEEELAQLQQEYSQLRSYFRLEREQMLEAIADITATLDEKAEREANELKEIEKLIEVKHTNLLQQLEALEAEQELIRSSIGRLDQQKKEREKALSFTTKEQAVQLPSKQTTPPLLLEEQVFEQYDGFSADELHPPTTTEMALARSKVNTLPPPTKLALHPTSKPNHMSTMQMDLLDDTDDVDIVVGTPAIPSSDDLPSMMPRPTAPLTPPPFLQSSDLARKTLKESSIKQLPTPLQEDIATFFNQLERIDWFRAAGPADEAHRALQQHIERLQPFAANADQPLPKVLAIFQSGSAQMHKLMATQESLSARVEEVFNQSLSEAPGNWSVAGAAVWQHLQQPAIPHDQSRFEASQWLVPWDSACDAILETTWFAANDVAWSAARNAPRFTASDHASDAANNLNRGQARSLLWSATWEHVRHAALRSVWAASNNAANDIANDIAWRLVQDHMATQQLRNPFSPLLQVWGAGWWPIHLASGDYILWSPMDEPNDIRIIWEMEQGAFAK